MESYYNDTRTTIDHVRTETRLYLFSFEIRLTHSSDRNPINGVSIGIFSRYNDSLPYIHNTRNSVLRARVYGTRRWYTLRSSCRHTTTEDVNAARRRRSDDDDDNVRNVCVRRNYVIPITVYSFFIIFVRSREHGSRLERKRK